MEALLPREGFHLAHAEVGIRKAASGDLDQGLRGVDSEGHRTDRGDQLKERSCATADVEHALARRELEVAEALLVGWDLLVLACRPVGCARSPESTPPAGTALLHGDRLTGHSRSFL
jgi:hypothetical protein